MLPPLWEELRREGGEAAAAAEAGSEAAGEAAGADGSDWSDGPVANLLFVGVRGQQEREGDAPSWFNPIEAVTWQAGAGLRGLETQPGSARLVQTPPPPPRQRRPCLWAAGERARRSYAG